MTAEMVFEETYTLLNKIGVVDTKREFCRGWLIEVIVICAV